MNLRDLNSLQKIEGELDKIRAILNPEDSPYICDTIITNIDDEELENLIKEMMLKMGYEKKLLQKVRKIIKEIQS